MLIYLQFVQQMLTRYLYSSNQNKFILYLYKTKKKDQNFYYLEINEKSRLNKDLILTNENKITSYNNIKSFFFLLMR